MDSLGRIQMCFDCDMDEKQRQTTEKFQDHLEEKYRKKSTLEDAQEL